MSLTVPTMYPNLDQSSLKNPAFGLDAKFPTNTTGQTSEAAAQTNATYTYDIRVKPQSVLQRAWTVGVPLWCFKMATVAAQDMNDLPTIRWMLRETKLFHLESKFGNRNDTNYGYGSRGNASGGSNKRSKTVPDETFLDIDLFAKKIAFAGVLFGVPTAETPATRWSGPNVPATGPLIAPLAYQGKVLFPNLFETTQAIGMGQKLYMLIKPIPLSKAGTHHNPQGEQCSTFKTATADLSRETLIEFIFYTTPDNTPPPRLTAEERQDLFNNVDKQPRLTCRQYKKFHPENPNLFSFEDGLVFEIGNSLFKYDATSSIHLDNMACIKTYTNDEINQKSKMEIILKIKQIF